MEYVHYPTFHEKCLFPYQLLYSWGSLPKGPRIVQNSLIQRQPLLNSKSQIISQIICPLTRDPPNVSLPFESLSVIVPSKSLNTITFVSPAINGIPPSLRLKPFLQTKIQKERKKVLSRYL